MSALKEMLALAERPKVLPTIFRDTSTQNLSITEIVAKSNQMMIAIKENSSPIEQPTIVELQDRMRDRLADLYPRLSFEPLKWRDDNGFPCLAIFSIDYPICKFEGHNTDFPSYSMEPNLFEGFKPLADCYSDIFDLLQQKAQQKVGLFRHTTKILCKIFISCRFNGLIPLKIRSLIKEAELVFPRANIFVIAEPRNWTLTSEEQIISEIDSDPLIVAYWGHSFRLIADFDTTGVEEAMIFEPTDKKD